MTSFTIYGGDIDEYLKCPYRLVKCKKEGIKPSYYLDSEFVKDVLITQGIEFEDKILSDIEWEKTDESLGKLIKKRCVINHPIIVVDGSDIRERVPEYFTEIRFVGCPDLIIPEKQSQSSIPLDIKHHKNVTKTDKYRIGFYAFLLKARFDIPISKGLILTTEGTKEVNVRDVYHKVLRIVEKIYLGVMEDYVKPRRCSECKICSLREECLEDLKNQKDLTLIYDIASKTSEKLRHEGIKNIDDLLVQDKYKILRLRAQSILNNQIIKIGEIDIPKGDSIYFDIETSIPENDKVWLIGYSCKNEFKQLYADDWKQEKSILERFLKFLKSLDNPILISCSCTNFDRRIVLDAIIRNKLDFEFFSDIPHYDLGLLLRRSFILPNMSYKVKDIGKFLGYHFKHEDLDGIEVAMAYSEHISKNEPLPEKYLEYNRDDILVLPFILNELSNRKDIVVNILEEHEKFIYLRGTSWSEEDLNILKEKYPKDGGNIKELINKGHSRGSIRFKARQLGIKCEFRGPRKGSATIV